LGKWKFYWQVPIQLINYATLTHTYKNKTRNKILTHAMNRLMIISNVDRYNATILR